MDWDRYEATAHFHGHFGPGIAIGYRICEEALRRFGLTWDETPAIMAITETETCPADAIQFLLGATFGKGRLIYLPTGKTAFSFYNRDADQSFRTLFVGKKPKGMDRKEWEAYILEAPFDELFETTEPARLAFPPEQRYYPDEICEVCGEGMSPLRTVISPEGKKLCYECALRAHLISEPWGFVWKD